MANRRVDYEKAYSLIMECRTSGLSDRQWCYEHDIPPSTFYSWVKRCRRRACGNIPESSFHAKNSAGEMLPVLKQDVVCLNIAPGHENAVAPQDSKIIISCNGCSIELSGNVDRGSLETVLWAVRRC